MMLYLDSRVLIKLIESERYYESWNRTMKRLILYVFGLFFLTLGISFSIQAGLGVSPVSSLAYAFALTTGIIDRYYNGACKCFIYYCSSHFKQTNRLKRVCTSINYFVFIWILYGSNTIHCTIFPNT